MLLNNGYTDMGRMYGECILYWMIENAVDIGEVDDFEMQVGSGLDDTQFMIGLNWLVEQQVLDRPRGNRLH